MHVYVHVGTDLGSMGIYKGARYINSGTVHSYPIRDLAFLEDQIWIVSTVELLDTYIYVGDWQVSKV